MKKDIKLINEIQQMKNLIKYMDVKNNILEQINSSVKIMFPNWLKDKLERVHIKIGQGSIFLKSINNIEEIVLNIVKNESNIKEIANSSGTIQKNIKNIGYDLVISKKDINSLSDVKFTKIIKEEGNNKILVNAITTTTPLENFKTDILTIIVRPSKDNEGNVIQDSYIILSVFPGITGADKRASEWGEDFYVVIPKE